MWQNIAMPIDYFTSCN